MRSRKTCGAHARSTGRPCCAKAMLNGRCRNHGGLSTGPKTDEGRIAEATSRRMIEFQSESAKRGLNLWLVNGGKEHLSRLAKQRHRRKRMSNLRVGQRD
jgi:excinuclease UvrABC nuclease subunit